MKRKVYYLNTNNPTPVVISNKLKLAIALQNVNKAFGVK